MSAPKYEPREFTITGTVRAPASVGAEQLAESLKRGLEQSRLGATVDLGDFTQYVTADDEPEFVVGQQVSSDDYDLLPVGARALNKDGDGITKTEGDPTLWKTDAGKICWPLHPRTLTHLPDATEPEDKADLYVEPEPLKEGDACLVWARFGRVDKLDVAHVELPMPDGRVYDGYIRPDAIVRPDAGQVPPWVKPAPLTIDPNDEEGAVAELAHAIADHCGVSVTFADLAKALAERSAAEGGAS